MHNHISDIVHDQVFLSVKDVGPDFYLKMESLNPAGSIKLKTAIGLVDDLQQRGLINAETILIESSSGNLGVALAMICAERGLKFTCVVDPNIADHNLQVMKCYGAEVVMIRQPDKNGGFLGSRINYIRSKLAEDPRYIWLNQYENQANPQVHAARTAHSVGRQFAHVDYLFVGAGTTGTLMGCVDHFQKYHPETKIIAVDSVGSVTFGTPAGRRYIPGLGTSQIPPIFQQKGIHALEMVDESATVAMCRYLARHHGMLVGGSTGTVIAGLYHWRERIPQGAVVVALSPDWGERYLDTVYDDGWVAERYPQETLSGGLEWVDAMAQPTVYLEEASSMPFHVVDGRTVASVLNEDPLACIDDVEKAYLAHCNGDTVNPDSYFLRFPENQANRIIALPASIAGENGSNGIKWISSYPDNIKQGLQRASAVLLLNKPQTGYAYACLEASRISAMRTAASAVLAARKLVASRNITRLGFVGAGFIARNILDLFRHDGWNIEKTVLHDKDQPSVEAFAEYAQTRHQLIASVGSLEEVLAADVVVLATTAGTPYIHDYSFKPHQLVLNISLRDLSPEIITRCNNLLDDVDHCLKANTSPHLAEQLCGHRQFINGTLAEFMLGRVALDPRKATLFSPFGLGILDLAVGQRVYQRACQQGRAREIPNFFFESGRW
ncbi:2,3-diaminopropionate biosynthesis protein SbnA [Klebsiella aerogenes]